MKMTVIKNTIINDNMHLSPPGNAIKVDFIYNEVTICFLCYDLFAKCENENFFSFLAPILKNERHLTY